MSENYSAPQISTHYLYAPTIVDQEGSRHMLQHRDGPTECGQQIEGEQCEPKIWGRPYLCPRCVQKFMRKVLEVNSGFAL